MESRCGRFTRESYRQAKYGNKSLKKEVHRAENATIKRAGKRLYIQLDNGREIIKMEKSVRWGDALTDTDQTVSFPEANSLSPLTKITPPPAT